MGGKSVKKIGKALGGEALGAAVGLPPGLGAAAGSSKFAQTTWNRLNGDGGKDGSKAKAVGGTLSDGGDGDAGANGVLGSDGDSDAETEEMRRRRAMRGTLVGNGPKTFGYGHSTETVGG